MCNKRDELGCAVKVQLTFVALYTRQGNEGDENEDEKRFSTENEVITLMMDEDDINAEIYNSWIDEINNRANEFEEQGSGWSMRSVRYLQIDIKKYAPLEGPSKEKKKKKALDKQTTKLNTNKLKQIDNKQIENKRAIINVTNKDDASFFWAIVSALEPATVNPCRVSSYRPYRKVINTNGIRLPIDFKNIRKFEDMNKNISITIYNVSGNTITGPIYLTKEKREKHIDLLFIKEEEGERKDNGGKYCWIKNMSKLLSSQLSNRNGKIWICDSCILRFYSIKSFINHEQQGCSKIEKKLPTNTILEFKNYKHQIPVPVIVYADFEALLIPADSNVNESSKLKKETTTNQKEESYTYYYQLHKPYSFGYFIKCNYDDSLSKYVSYRGNDCADVFVDSLEKELRPFIDILKRNKKMQDLNNDQKEEFATAANCHICDEKLNADKVRDHCHLTGEYRGAAHENCNLKYKIAKVIPIVLHNLSKYDSHFIIRALKSRKPVILAKNKENYISISYMYEEVKLKFIDSFRFLTNSLDKLTKNLNTEQFVNMRKHFSEHLDFLQKGVFPYDYITSFEKLEETSLPPLNYFHNKLNNTDISLEQYERAKKIWKYFELKTLGEYSDLYLKADVLLLADVFENFREVCLKAYRLDPAHYVGGPGVSWDAMLRYTRIKIELLTDLSMIEFISKGIRGGLSQCCVKHEIANNKYLNHYDPRKPSNFIIYLDANNQYGWAMSKYLPLKGFRWLSESEMASFDVMQISDKAAKGFILEVDLDYPIELHDSHNDLCFCPESRVPEVSRSSKNKKLLATLYPKQNYVIHYMNLKQAINNGLVLKKIHRVLTFDQRPWLKKYIDMNTNMRKNANKSEREFYKLMNNSIYGKTIENVEKRVDVRVLNRWEKNHKSLGAGALIAKPNFHSYTKVEEDLIIIQMKKTKIVYDKPTFVGFAVLEISKTLMYDFHYQYMVPKYGKNVSLLYTDTDSFVYNIKTEDFYADIEPELDSKFDTSNFNFPPTNIYKRDKNQLVVGMFKDECGGKMIREFIGIRSKCYYIKKDSEDSENDGEIKRIKGVKKDVVQEEVTRDHFFECASGSTPKQYFTMNVIRSKAHTLYSQTLNKIGLNNYDDKRFTIPNTYKTLAWGHNKIKEFQ